MSKLDRVIVALVILWLVIVSIRQAMIIDRTDDLNKSVKTLAGAAMDLRMRCDIAGERTDELWEEVFDGDRIYNSTGRHAQ